MQKLLQTPMPKRNEPNIEDICNKVLGTRFEYIIGLRFDPKLTTSSSSRLSNMALIRANDGVVQGGNPQPDRLMMGFKEAVADSQLIDLGMQGYGFTWSRGNDVAGRIEERLDRALACSRWIRKFPYYKVSNLEVTSSDHSPIFLEPIAVSFQVGVKRFRFENAWLRDSQFLSVVKIFWRQRAKMLWLQDGDSNSKLFHAVASKRRRKNQITHLQDHTGVIRDWNSGLANMIVDYFQVLFKATM
ncbi:hypothetical protein K2173_021727 [Erythroxylum novogranatense]|uniref:Uncharacterized protein n=1 Tax=Erythroxylum novogranatense TaxID=1862640 RepID=A0AAV8THD7_9ROSI|nr:hypothetical protein K2173_021727 [Erythroxylum novogranatense]